MNSNAFMLCETLEIATPERTGRGIDNRWAVQLVGIDDDVSDLLRVMCEESDEFSTVVYIIGDEIGNALFVLSSCEWNSLNDPYEVQMIAATLLSLAVGWLNLIDGCRPVTVGTIYEFLAGGRCVMRRFSPQKIIVKKQAAERMLPSLFRRLMDLSDRHDWLAACLAPFEGEATFYDIYIGVEAIIRHCGSERAMKDRPELKGVALAQVKNVADFHRHFRRPNRKPPEPMFSLDECMRILAEAIIKLSASQIGPGVKVIWRDK